ncbi:hypothetical protein GCM10027591_03910 [Zhihengliuella somnathii]
MGRHTASSRRKSGPPAKPRFALLGWGLFAAVVTGLCGPALGMKVGAAAALSTTTALAFAVLWAVSLWVARTTPRD